jgi:hypothetical protein
MTTDIVERKRDADRRGVAPPQSWTTDAADEIERLRAEVDELRQSAADDEETITAAANELRRLRAELAEAKETLQFVERWANHHGAKPTCSAEAALSCIQHYPPIVAITRSYTDGKVPDTPNPWAEVAALRADAERYRWLRTTCAAEQARSIFSVAAPAEIDAAIDAALAAKEPK